MQLPLELRSAIEHELAGWSAKELGSLAADVSGRYRSPAPAPGGRLIRRPEEVVAYAAFRLPATYAALHAVLTQVKEEQPGWSPRSLLDVGAGPGTATWAAADVFPTLSQATLLERDDAMIDFGRRLAARAAHAVVREATWVKADATAAWEAPPHDLVIASYILGELPEDAREPFVRKLWESTAGMLLLIEPGTPRGFGHIHAARQRLIDLGAALAAPCPHAGPCPIAGSDWCHFSQRVERSRLHRQVKDAELSYEDEKFSFVVASRLPAAPVPGRVIRHPQVRKGYLDLHVCTADGRATTVRVTRKARDRYRQARDLRWGSPLPPDVMDPPDPH